MKTRQKIGRMATIVDGIQESLEIIEPEVAFGIEIDVDGDEARLLVRLLRAVTDDGKWRVRMNKGGFGVRYIFRRTK